MNLRLMICQTYVLTIFVFTGALRLIRPIRGPREFNLRMVLENYSQTQHLLISRHVTNVYVHVSAFEF